MSEQQVNPKVLSVVNFCHYNYYNILKMANIVYKEKCSPIENCPNKSPPPGQMLGCKSPRTGPNFWCKSLAVHQGMVMDEIYSCIIKMWNNIKKNWLYVDYLH